MKPALFLLAICGLTVAAHAEEWSGKLIDSSCNDQREQMKTISCDATSATTVFALDVAGKIFKLDPAGNVKAQTALKYRVAPPPDPAKPPSTQIAAKITGTEAGGMIIAETVALQ